ncbi:hypothetical protein GCM10027590_08700 [Nocardiopsis nanhaiensis]
MLDLTERAANGYKRYEVPHLVRLLKIKRLVDLGFPLSAVASMERADEEPDKAIHVLDKELEATVNRLNRVRGSWPSSCATARPLTSRRGSRRSPATSPTDSGPC